VRWEKALGGAQALGWGLFGGAVGGVYSLVAGDWHDGRTWDQLWITMALMVACVVIAAFCLAAAIGRRWVTRSHGTAYVIKEEADAWSKDRVAADKFLAESRRQFAKFVNVPGPVDMDNSWRWKLDDDAAARWDAKLNELAVAFRALRSSGNPESPNGVFIWAWWPVAMAFGMRVVAAERGLELDVWRRPSFGRTPQEAIVPWESQPHDFGQPGTAAGSLQPLQRTWPMRLTVSSAAGAASGAHAASGAPADVMVLLIRVGRQPWGGIPNAELVPRPEAGQRYELDVRDVAGACAGGKAEVELHELRYDVPILSVPWDYYPSIVTACADWIVERAASVPARTPLLLGMQVPQEVGLGIGIRAGYARRSGWPARMWPLMYAGGTSFVVPRLDLGTAALDGVS
jgi:hypothetical protein